MTEYYSVTELLANTYWKDRRFEWASGNPVYIGVNRKPNAPEGDREWQVYKITWSGDTVTRMQGPVEGSWENRAGLGW